MQKNEEQQRYDVYCRTSDLWDLGQRGEDHWSEAVAQDEEGYPEGAGDGGDVELGGEGEDAGGVDGGADVYAEGEETDGEGDEATFGE